MSLEALKNSSPERVIYFCDFAESTGELNSGKPHHRGGALGYLWRWWNGIEPVSWVTGGCAVGHGLVSVCGTQIAAV